MTYSTPSSPQTFDSISDALQAGQLNAETTGRPVLVLRDGRTVGVAHPTPFAPDHARGLVATFRMTTTHHRAPRT